MEWVGGLVMGGCWWRMVVVVRVDCVWRWATSVRTWWMVKLVFVDRRPRLVSGRVGGCFGRVDGVVDGGGGVE